MAGQTYTLDQAAETVMLRQDTITALLSEIGVDLAERSPAVISQAEMDTLARAAQAVKDHKEELFY